MGEAPQAVVDASRARIDEWAAQSRLLLIAEDDTRWAVEQVADTIAALGHPGAGRALADAACVVTLLTDAVAQVTGEEYSAEQALALLGMAGLVLADREAGHA